MSVPSSTVPGTPDAAQAPPQPQVVHAAPASVAGSAIRQDLVHADPLLDCLVEI